MDRVTLSCPSPPPPLLLDCVAQTYNLRQITYLDEYYLTNDEIELLKKHSVEIAATIPDGAMVIELGSGYVHALNAVCPPRDSELLDRRASGLFPVMDGDTNAMQQSPQGLSPPAGVRGRPQIHRLLRSGSLQEGAGAYAITRS